MTNELAFSIFMLSVSSFIVLGGIALIIRACAYWKYQSWLAQDEEETK